MLLRGNLLHLLWCVVMGITMVMRCTHAQLTPSCEVLVCPDAVLEITCNVIEQGFLQWTVMSQQIEPPVYYPIDTQFFNESLLGVPLPQSPRAPGITVTPHIVSSALISATMTVDTANYDLHTLGPIEVTCAGEHAVIRELGMCINFFKTYNGLAPSATSSSPEIPLYYGIHCLQIII